MDANSVPAPLERTPQPSEAAVRPRAEPVEAIGCGSERPTPTVLGERRPFVSDAANPAAKRSRSDEALCCLARRKRVGVGRVRPTVAGVLRRCAVTLFRVFRSAKTRQFLIGGSIGSPRVASRRVVLCGRIRELLRNVVHRSACASSRESRLLGTAACPPKTERARCGNRFRCLPGIPSTCD
jgi:hypothetical protein